MVPFCASRQLQANQTETTCVAQGRWKGALVAIKVVEHNMGGTAIVVEGARESLLTASVSHPNVVRETHLEPCGSTCGATTRPDWQLMLPCMVVTLGVGSLMARWGQLTVPVHELFQMRAGAWTLLHC